MKISNKFGLGVGNPEIREMLCNKIPKYRRVITSLISNQSYIGSFDKCFVRGGTDNAGVGNHQFSNDW